MTTNEHATIGFCAHTGWAAAVVLAGAVDLPRVVARSRVELWDATDPQVFHQAAELDLAAAGELVSRAETLSRSKAGEALRALLEALQVRVVAAGIVGGAARVPSDLASVLRSHPLVHAAEGELFRSALVAASKQAGLKVTVVPSRVLLGEAAAALRVSEPHLSRCIADLGRPVGSPWGKDQKEAASVAWLALVRAAG